MAENSNVKSQYRCLNYPREYVGTMEKLRGHFYKEHVSLAQVPYLCTLCHFRAETAERLKSHIRYYRPHQTKFSKACLQTPGMTDEMYFRPSTDPIVFNPAVHVIRYDSKFNNSTHSLPSPISHSDSTSVSASPALNISYLAKSSSPPRESTPLTFPDELLELNIPHEMSLDFLETSLYQSPEPPISPLPSTPVKEIPRCVPANQELPVMSSEDIAYHPTLVPSPAPISPNTSQHSVNLHTVTSMQESLISSPPVTSTAVDDGALSTSAFHRVEQQLLSLTVAVTKLTNVFQTHSNGRGVKRTESYP